VKKRFHAALCTQIIQQRIEHIEAPKVHIHMVWYIKNLRTDPDNVAWAKKYVLDALVACSVLTNDSMKYILSLSDDFMVVDEQQCGVMVECFIPKPISHGHPSNDSQPGEPKRRTQRKTRKTLRSIPEPQGLGVDDGEHPRINIL
jgi:hypothetical protein